MMRIVRLTGVLIGAVVLSAAMPARAADQTGGERTSRLQTLRMMSGTFRLTELIDKTVKTPKGEELGEIEDVVISNGQTRYLILFRRGSSGSGEPVRVPLPFFVFHESTFKDHTLVVPGLTRQKLEQAPAICEKEWNELSSSEFETRVFTYYADSEPCPQEQQEAAASSGSKTP